MSKFNKIEDFQKTLKPNEIDNSLEEFNPKKHRLILGNCYFEERLDITDLGVLEMIGGDADFRDSKVENLGNLTTIVGYAYFSDSKVENLGNLTTIGGGAYFENSKIENLGKLTTIVGYADFDDSKVENLGNLTTIGGYADFRDSKVENLGNLTTVRGSINTNDNKLTRKQDIDHLNKMNDLFFVERNNLYYPIPNLSVFNIIKVILNRNHKLKTSSLIYFSQILYQM